MDSRLLTYLAENKDRLTPLLIVTHDYPDPDALASALALMYLAERQYGIRGKIVYGGSIGRSENREMARLLNIPAHKLRSTDFKRYANVALVDTQPGFDNNSFPHKKKAAIVIDQHASDGSPNADFVLVDHNAGATSALLARELLESGMEIPTRLATALVYGILSDTLDFYRMTNRETIELYLRLLRYADMRMLARIQNPSRPRRFFCDMAAGIDKARIRGTLIFSHLGPIESPEQVAQMADFLLTCEGIQWTFCSGTHREYLHLSLRTDVPDGQAANVLRDICNHPREAGGHGQMAGGKIKIGSITGAALSGTMEEILTERLLNRLGISRRARIIPLVERKVLTSTVLQEQL